MQQRFRIASTDTHEEAVQAIDILREKFPEKTFQIRRTHKGFKVVERSPVEDSIQLVSSKPKRKRRKNRGSSPIV